MAAPVTPEFLLKGSIYALEQCGLLLRDANILFRKGSFASAVVLAAFAREELGRSTILHDLRREVLSGKKCSLDDIQNQCDDHVTKQQAGMLSLTFAANRDTGLGKVLQARIESHPQSEERKEADAELKRIGEQKTKRVPSDRHRSRMSALYVDPVSEHGWNRPIEKISADCAHDFLKDAANDYSLRYHNGYITGDGSALEHLDEELYAALEAWPDRPVLLPPEWPIQPA